MSDTLNNESNEADPDTIELLINPPAISPYLNKKEIEQSILVTNMMVDEDKEGYRIDLDLAFRTINVKREKLQPADYFVGTQSIRVTLDADNATVTSHTPSKQFETNYKNTYSRDRTRNLTLLPPSAKKPNSSLNFKSGSKTQYEVNFQGVEHELAATLMPGRVEWDLSMPQGVKAIREYTLGNLYLYLVVGWQGLPRKGSILVRHSDISFFNSEKRKITNPFSELAMRYVMWKKDIEVPPQDALKIDFEVKHGN